ncbi:MAG: radical SAM protein [bacterium]
MKKVLLLNPPYSRPIMRDTFHPTSKSLLYIWHPLDLLIQSGYLSDYDVRLHDGVVDNRMSSLNSLLEEFRPDAVLSLVAWPTLKSDMELLERIKKTYKPVIFTVGDITYGEKEKFLETYPFLDGILADYTSRGFTQYLSGEPVKNAAWREDGDILTEWTHEPMDYGCPRHDLLDLSRYYLPYWKPPFGSVYTSHGCPAKCKFCVAPGWGPTRFRKHEAVLEELEFLDSLGVSKIFFRDGSFNQKPRYMMGLLEEVARRLPGRRLTTWFKPRPLNDEMAKVMKAAGFQFVHMGVETGSPDFLRRIGKDFELEDVEPGIEILHRNGIKVVGHFMLGVPGETEEDYRLTVRFLKKTKLDVISFGVFEYSFGITLKEGESEPILVRDDRKLRFRLLYLMFRFFLSPGRWRRIYFFEDIFHLSQSIPRVIQYAANLRLYPRFKALK